VCVDCFEPLAINATVTITRRTVFVPPVPLFFRPAQYRWLTVSDLPDVLLN
jgi:hypothetical protein